MGFNVWNSIIIGLLLWLITSASYPGLEFSQDCRYMRNYYGLFNYKIGRWERLPIIIGVTIKQFSELSKSTSTYDVGVWDSSSKLYTEVIIMLSVKDSSNGIIIARFSKNDIAQAIELASNTAEKFGVPVNTYLPAHLFKSL